MDDIDNVYIEDYLGGNLGGILGYTLNTKFMLRREKFG